VNAGPAPGSPRRVAVIGAGPVGQVVAAHLLAGGHEVVLVDVSAAVRDHLNQRGITLSGVVELSAPAPVAATASIEDITDSSLDLVVLAVKAPILPLVCSAVQDAAPREATVLSWQNGIDTERSVARYIAPDRIVRGVVNYGVNLTGDGGVNVVFHHPPHYVKEYHEDGRPRAEAVAGLFSGSGLDTRRAEDLVGMVWKKAILNAGLNALCALTGLDMANAWHDPYAADLARKIMQEGIRVARSNEIFVGWDYYRWAQDYLAAAGAHKPSMLVDREAGRMSEIDFINGKIVEYGEFAGIPTPYNETVVRLLKAIEAKEQQG
jgi:2-dehydropantoate 2-reductase